MLNWRVIDLMNRMMEFIGNFLSDFELYTFLVFGLGTLIFTGLEIAMHATMETNCVEDIVIAHPILQALFTFLQMHFLFVNSQVQMGKIFG